MKPSRLVVAAVIALGMTSAASAQSKSAGGSPTFTKDVAPILFAQCTTCHRPGEIAPMSLLTYKDARPWARSIAAKVADGTMPPWHADPAYGQFSNERRLTAAQKDTIAKWVAAGAPEGDAKDLPAAPKYAEGWRIGQPDAVLSMQEDYPIPASGMVPYQYFEVPANYTEDRWIQAWELRPGNRAVVHHVIVYTRTAPKPPALQAGARRRVPGRRQSSNLPTAWTFPPDRLVVRHCRTVSVPHSARTIVRVRAAPAHRSAATSPATPRASSPKARRCVFRRARRSSSRCTTRRWARRRPIAPKWD